MTDCLYGNNLSIENAGESLQSNVHDEDEEVKIDQCPSTTTNDEENNNRKSQFTPSTDSYSNPSESNQDSNLTTPNRQNVHSTNFIPPQFLMANPFVTGGHFSDSNTVNEENSAAPQNYFVTPQYYRQLLQEYMEKLTLEHERSIIDGRTGVSPASELGEIVYDDIQESIERLKLKRSCKSEEGNEQNHMENKEEEKQLDENRGIKEKPESNVEMSCQFDEPIARNELNSDHMIDENSTGSKNGEKERATVAVLTDDFNKKTLKQTTPVSPESRTAVLIKKQINEIEKQLMRRAQNENIKKIDPSELHEFLTDITTTNGEDNPCSDNVSNFRENFTPSQQFTAASTPQHPAAAFYNAAHFFHLLRMQQNDNSIPWDGKLNNSMFNNTSSPEKDAKTLAELAATASSIVGENFRPTADFSMMPHPAYFQTTAAPTAAAFPHGLATAPFITQNGVAVDHQQRSSFVQAHFPQVSSNGSNPSGLPHVAPGAYLPLLAAAAASQWPQAATTVLAPPAAHHSISLANFAPAFYPSFFVDPRSIYQQQQIHNYPPAQPVPSHLTLSENFHQPNNCPTTEINNRATRAASNPPPQAINCMQKFPDSVPHTDKGSLTNLQSFSSSYDDLRQTDSNSLYSSHSHNKNLHNNKQCIPQTDDSSNPTSPHNYSNPKNNVSNGPPCGDADHRDVRMSSELNAQCDDPVWILRESYVRKLPNNVPAVRSPTQNQNRTNTCQTGHVDSDTDTETDNLLGLQRLRKYQKVPTNDQNSPEQKTNNVGQQANKQKKKKEVMIHEPAVLIEGVLFRAKYLGSTQILCDGRPTKASRMMQAQEAVTRIKLPDGETQPCTDVDLFISTEKIMVLNTDMQRISETDVRQDIMMDHPLRTISYIADIADLVVLMARRVSQASPDEAENIIKKTPKLICHVFESDEAQFIAQSIGQAFQVAYMEFLRANGIEDPGYLREMDYQEVLNSQEMLGEELELFARKETQKDVVVPKQKNEILGMVIVESGWGSMLPTVVVANLMPGGPAARCNQINVGDHIIAVNGISFVGLPLAKCQEHIKNVKQCTAVRMTMVHTPPVVEVRIKRPDTKYQLGFSVQNGVICSLLRGGIAERGGIRVGHRIIEINGQSVVAVVHEKIVTMLATAVGEIQMKTMPTSMFRLLTGQEQPIYI